MQRLTARAIKIIKFLQTHTKNMPEPLSVLVNQEFGHDPFLILISCLLSLRTRDVVTYKVCKKLFQQARTPAQLLAIPLNKLENIVHPLGFYKRKAKTLHSVSKDLLERFDGNVPHTEKELLSIKGVGRKTANLVLGQAFGIPALCVDTHVHRLSNEFCLVKTKTPAQTEEALKKIVPKKYWIEYNHLLVKWGQNMRNTKLPMK